MRRRPVIFCRRPLHGQSSGRKRNGAECHSRHNAAAVTGGLWRLGMTLCRYARRIPQLWLLLYRTGSATSLPPSVANAWSRERGALPAWRSAVQSSRKSKTKQNKKSNHGERQKIYIAKRLLTETHTHFHPMAVELGRYPANAANRDVSPHSSCSDSLPPPHRSALHLIRFSSQQMWNGIVRRGAHDHVAPLSVEIGIACFEHYSFVRGLRDRRALISALRGRGIRGRARRRARFYGL